MKKHGFKVSIILAALVVGLSFPAFCGSRAQLLDELRTIVDEKNAAVLLTEIQRLQSFYDIRRLAQYQDAQNAIGGENCGCVSGQLTNADEIPLPVDEIGVLQAAVFLAEQRENNLDDLARLGFPMEFAPRPSADAPQADPPPNMTLHIDWSVPVAFLDALDDGEVTMVEASDIARMPANQEMLQFVWKRREGPGPCVTEQTLPYFIWRAGSTDPLAHLWRWLNPMNDFGYAEVAVNAAQYRDLIEELRVRHQDIANQALARIVSFLPPDREIDETFALTIGCLATDWATPEMSGASVWRAKNGWEDLVQSISAGIYRRQLLELWRPPDGETKRTNDDLAKAGLPDEGYELFHELIAYTVLEGAVGFVSSPSVQIDEAPKVTEGAGLIDRYVLEVIEESHVNSARPIIEQGRGPGGPLCALGRHLAGVVAEQEGPQGLAALIEHGPVAFFKRALEIEASQDEDLFNQETMVAVRDHSIRLAR